MKHTEWTRRDFLSATGQAAMVSLAGSAIACGGSSVGDAVMAPGRGSIEGTVVDLNGVAQPGLGLITLLYDSGLHTGASVKVDANGQFGFSNLTAGDYQIRFDAPGEAHIPDGVLHPIRFSVKAGEPTPVTVDVEIGGSDYAEIEIYAGDYFYQWQPNGIENGEAVAKIGVIVCWYNVGKQIHTVTGGPWGDSGDMQRTASFMWLADRVGLFGYRDKYFPTMLGTLRIIA